MLIKAGTIWKNTVFVTFSQIIRIVTNLLIFIGVARFYSTESLGQFSLAFQVANICLIVADFGFDTLLATKIANQRNNPLEIIRQYFSMKLVLILISIIIMISITLLEAISYQSKILVFSLILYMVFATLINFCFAVFRGFQRFEYETKNSFISNAVLLFLLLIFGWLHIPLIYIMMFFVFSRLLGFILGLKTINKLVNANIISLDFSNWKGIVKEILVFGLQYIFGNVYFLMDTVLIGIWLGDYATGIYQAGFRIMLLALIVVDVIRSPLLPIFSRLYFEDRKCWIDASKLYYKILVFLAIPIMLVFFFASDILIQIIYGQGKYYETIPLLKIFGVITLIRLLGDPFILVFTTSQRQHILMIFAILGSVLSFVLNLLLLKQFGVMGAIWVSVGVNIFVNIVPIVFIEKNIFKVLFEKSQIIIWFFFLSSFIVMYLTSNYIVMVMCLLGFLAMAYTIGLSPNERKLLFSKFATKTTG